MHKSLKIWTQLGLGTAVAGGMLAACSGEAGEQGEAAQNPERELGVAVSVGEGGESGEAGEGGEAGIDVTRAASDPVVFRSALAVTEAHVIAARDAFAAGQRREAAEMFAHPVSEVLVEMAPVFAKQGVADFSPLLTEASAAVFDGENTDQINARYQRIISALRGAAGKAPTSSDGEGVIAAGVVADQIERAVAMHREAIVSSSYGPYLDGYGFSRAAANLFEVSQEAIQRANPVIHTRIAEALGLLENAYPSAIRPQRLEVEQGALVSASSKVMLALGNAQ